jgi:deoxyribodipyrimidine photo-lyase
VVKPEIIEHRFQIQYILILASYMNDIKIPVTVFWFRRDLRLNDNHGLYKALKKSKNVLPIFIFDTDILDKLPSKKDQRVSFIHSALTQINLKLLSVESSLMIKHANTLKVFEELCATFVVEEVMCNHDYEPQAIQRDTKIAEWLSKKGIPFNTFKDQVIFEKNDILKSDGKPYTIFTPFAKQWKLKLQTEGKIRTFDSERLLEHLYKTKSAVLPSLNEIGFEETTSLFPLQTINKTIIQQYHETRNVPSVKGTTNLSVHLRFGTLSIRELVNIALPLNEQWLNELIWREFFMMILFHYPKVITQSFKAKYDKIQWRNNEKEFQLWCQGETGYPIVDAGMRELNETGLMHNRVRMVVASFLTKHLLIDWRWGEAYFADKLLDYDLSANNGNWQWAAGCGCDAAPYFRIFNPYEQVKRFDPDLIYIQKWVKNLNEMDYPQAIVEHKFARERVLKVYKKALGDE